MGSWLIGIRHPKWSRSSEVGDSAGVVFMSMAWFEEIRQL